MAERRITFSETGSPDVLQWGEVDLPSPGAGEVRLRHDAIGLNFVDAYHRTGVYPMKLPSGLGSEAAGTVESVGPGVTDFKPGDRVAYAMAPIGSYSTARNIPADFLIPLPDDIPSDIAAAAMLKGMTTEYLVERCSRIAPGQTALVYAAAGGVGSILVQWLKTMGVRVLGHASNAEKAAQALALGADAVTSIAYQDLPAWVQENNGGEKAQVIFDAVGANSWQASLASIARRGLIVSYGNASGPVPPFIMLDLMKPGSIFVTRPGLADYCATVEERRLSAGRLFEMIRSGAVKIRIGQRFPLAEAAAAHRAMESRLTTASTILIP